MAEYWDIYDSNRRKTGRVMLRNDWHMKPGEYHLTVLGIITDIEGHFLITQRKRSKEWAPLSWEVPGGGVRAGEDSRTAVLREASEETGLDLSGAYVMPVDSYRSDSPEEQNNYFVDIYHITADFEPGDVHVQESETEGFRITDLDEIKKIGGEGKFLHYSRLLPSFEKVCRKKESERMTNHV